MPQQHAEVDSTQMSNVKCQMSNVGGLNTVLRFIFYLPKFFFATNCQMSARASGQEFVRNIYQQWNGLCRIHCAVVHHLMVEMPYLLVSCK